MTYIAYCFALCARRSYGNLVVSASKDATVKFWDCVSGACVHTQLPQ